MPCTLTFCKDHSEVFEEEVTVVTNPGKILMAWTEVVAVTREWGRERLKDLGLMGFVVVCEVREDPRTKCDGGCHWLTKRGREELPHVPRSVRPGSLECNPEIPAFPGEEY